MAQFSSGGTFRRTRLSGGSCRLHSLEYAQTMYMSSENGLRLKPPLNKPCGRKYHFLKYFVWAEFENTITAAMADTSFWEIHNWRWGWSIQLHNNTTPPNKAGCMKILQNGCKGNLYVISYIQTRTCREMVVLSWGNAVHSLIQALYFVCAWHCVCQ